MEDRGFHWVWNVGPSPTATDKAADRAADTLGSPFLAGGGVLGAWTNGFLPQLYLRRFEAQAAQTVSMQRLQAVRNRTVELERFNVVGSRGDVRQPVRLEPVSNPQSPKFVDRL